jgi:hypothetical protein
LVRSGVGEKFAVAVEQAKLGVPNIAAIWFYRGVQQRDMEPAMRGGVIVAVAQDEPGDDC